MSIWDIISPNKFILITVIPTDYWIFASYAQKTKKWKEINDIRWNQRHSSFSRLAANRVFFKKPKKTVLGIMLNGSVCTKFHFSIVFRLFRGWSTDSYREIMDLQEGTLYIRRAYCLKTRQWLIAGTENYAGHTLHYKSLPHIYPYSSKTCDVRIWSGDIPPDGDSPI